MRIQSRARGGQARLESRERRRVPGGPHGAAPHYGGGRAPGAVGAPGAGTHALAVGASGRYGQSQGYPSYAQQQGYVPQQGYAPQQQSYALQLPPSVGYGAHGAHGYGGAAAAWPPGGGCQPGHPVY